MSERMIERILTIFPTVLLLGVGLSLTTENVLSQITNWKWLLGVWLISLAMSLHGYLRYVVFPNAAPR